MIVAGGHPSWGDMVTILATTALRISEVAGLQVRDVDLGRGLLHVLRQTYPGRGGLVTKGRKDVAVGPPDHRPAATDPRTTDIGRRGGERLLRGPRGGV